MSNVPLMPMATAVWLVDNTSLSFKQIANFCNLHEVEVQGIADGEVAKGIKGYNPIISGQLTKEEIDLSSKDINNPQNFIDFESGSSFGSFSENSYLENNSLQYHNDGIVKWLGGFTQIEYSSDKFSIFSVSNPI